MGEGFPPIPQGRTVASERVWGSRKSFRSARQSGKFSVGLGVAVHTFNPSTRETEADRAQSLRPAWSTQRFPGHPGLHVETPCLQNKTKPKFSGGSGEAMEIWVAGTW